MIRKLALPLLLAALVTAPAPARAEPGAAEPGKVRVTVVAVKASPAAPGVEPGIGPGLEKVASKLQRLHFSRHEHDSTTERDIAPGEHVTIAFAGTGRLVVGAKLVEGGGVALDIEEFAPGAEKPCLTQRARIDSGRTHVTFCDGVPTKDTTLVFLSTVQAP